jgi:hypothetical protein
MISTATSTDRLLRRWARRVSALALLGLLMLTATPAPAADPPGPTPEEVTALQELLKNVNREPFMEAALAAKGGDAQGLAIAGLRTKNCPACVLTTQGRLTGAGECSAVAKPAVENVLGISLQVNRAPQSVATLEEAAALLQKSGDGTNAIICAVGANGKPGHAFNAIVREDRVIGICSQANEVGTLQTALGNRAVSGFEVIIVDGKGAIPLANSTVGNGGKIVTGAEALRLPGAGGANTLVATMERESIFAALTRSPVLRAASKGGGMGLTLGQIAVIPVWGFVGPIERDLVRNAAWEQARLGEDAFLNPVVQGYTLQGGSTDHVAGLAIIPLPEGHWKERLPNSAKYQIKGTLGPDWTDKDSQRMIEFYRKNPDSMTGNNRGLEILDSVANPIKHGLVKGFGPDHRGHGLVWHLFHD